MIHDLRRQVQDARPAPPAFAFDFESTHDKDVAGHGHATYGRSDSVSTTTTGTSSEATRDLRGTNAFNGGGGGGIILERHYSHERHLNTATANANATGNQEEATTPYQHHPTTSLAAPSSRTGSGSARHTISSRPYGREQSRQTLAVEMSLDSDSKWIHILRDSNDSAHGQGNEREMRTWRPTPTPRTSDVGGDVPVGANTDSWGKGHVSSQSERSERSERSPPPSLCCVSSSWRCWN